MRRRTWNRCWLRRTIRSCRQLPWTPSSSATCCITSMVRGLLSQAGENAEAGRTHRGHRVLHEAAAIGAAREHEDFRRRADWRAAGGGLPQNEELRFSALLVLRGGGGRKSVV